jgi:O-antigen/teichoic acid export membrane protein
VDAQLEPLRSARARLLRGLTRRGTQWLVVGSVLGGLGAYLFQIVGTRALGEEAYAPIGTLWTIQFLTWSIFLQPIESFVTREVVTGRAAPSLSRTVAVRTWAWVALVAGTVAGTSWLAGERLFYGVEGLAVVAGLIAVSFGAFAFVRGGLAGHERFRAYGFVSAAESLLRFALAVVVVVIVPTTRALAWTMPFGAAIAASFWFVVRGDPGGPPVGAPEGLGPSRAGRFLVLTSAANAAGQLLLAGGPLALVALAAAPSELSVFFVTITAARVPVVLALGGLLSRLLPTFGRILAARGRDAVSSLAARIAVGTVAVAAVGAALGFAAGSQLIGLFFGSGFEPPPWLAAIAAGGVLIATGGMVLNQLLVAAGLEHRLPIPWIGGLLAGSLVLMIVDGTPTQRVAAGFISGEIVALVALLVAARWRHRSGPRVDPGDRGGPERA